VSRRLEVTPALPGARGVQRVLQRHMAAAVGALKAKPPDNKRIHEARKSLKAARAALRLLRPMLGERRYQAENRRLRDAGRQLSAVRDGAVLVSTLEDLQVKTADPDCSDQLLALAVQLRQQAVRDWKRARRLGIARAQRDLRRVAARVAAWSFPPHEWRGVCEGLLRTYRKGRREARSNRGRTESACLHEWRKSTKYLSNQLLMLRPLQRASLAPAARELHRLSNKLGDDHDLAVLSDVAGKRAAHAGAPPAAGLQKLISKRRKTLQHRARSLGKSAFAEKPAHFAARLRDYVASWPDG
jgi:CHAD domain-containing protein